MSVWIAVASALARIPFYLALRIGDRGTRYGALIAAIGFPALWVTCDFLRKLRSGWRRWSNRPYV